MRYTIVVAIIVTILALGAALYGCKKKEEVAPPAETAAETEAAISEEEVVCPAPGEDLICVECKELFVTDDEYAAHMEKQHPEKWTVIKEKFHEMRKGEEGEETTK
ncbi:MAG: hypothetical protein GTN49_12500 [candidate division Zixibacteria bacterium]|nr:hypothetical protein [candidate division Zixibacteria bacterium]